jgi:hypothetical protein
VHPQLDKHNVEGRVEHEHEHEHEHEKSRGEGERTVKFRHAISPFAPVGEKGRG